MSTEVEFGGVKFTGGKMFVLLTALSTLGGAAWGGFQVYADYMNMKEIIANIDTDALLHVMILLKPNWKKLLHIQETLRMISVVIF